MSQVIRMPEVTAMLDKSSDTVQRYIKLGLLQATKSGRDFLFDRDEVVRFAESRGIQIRQDEPEREVPQGENFFMEWARLIRNAPPGATIAYTVPPRPVAV